MADHEEHKTAVVVDETAVEVETRNRGLFDCFGKKNKEVEEEKVVVTEFVEKVEVSDSKTKQEEDKDDHEKKQFLLDKLHRSKSSSSSSGDEEGEEKEKKKKKKKKEKKKKVEEEGADTTMVIMESCEVEVEKQEAKKGFMEKVKEKLPGGHKRIEEEQNESPRTPPSASTMEEKKGFLEKIKEKLPGFHSKEDKEKEKDKEEKVEKEHGSC